MQRRIARLTLALVVAALVATLYVTRVADAMRDFEVYWQSGARAAAAEPLYRASDEHYRLKYLPAFAVVMMPVASLPLPAAKAAWFVLSVASLAIVFHLSVGLLGRPRWPRWLLVGGAAVATAKFHGHELVLGQTNLVMTALVALGLAALVQGRDRRAGWLFGAATVAKPYAILLLPYLVAARRVSAARTLLVACATAVALPVVRYGAAGTVEQHRRWLETILGSTPATLATQDNVSVFAFFAKWLDAGLPALALGLASAAALLALVAVTIARRPPGVAAAPEHLEVAMVLLLIPLVSPQGWDYVLVAGTPAIVLALNGADRLGPAWSALLLGALAVMGLSLYDVMGRSAYAGFMAWSAVTPCAVAVAVVLHRLRARGMA